MPWECENERHTYEKYVRKRSLPARQLRFYFPPIQVSVRRVSLNMEHNPLPTAHLGFVQLYAPYEGALEKEARRIRLIYLPSALRAFNRNSTAAQERCESCVILSKVNMCT